MLWKPTPWKHFACVAVLGLFFATPAYPYGDFDGSGHVGQSDLALLLLNWGADTPPIPEGWVNDLPNGQIGGGELDEVLLNWGEGILAASAPQSSISNVMLTEVANTIPGFVTTDISISFEGQYTGSQLYLAGITPGQIYNHEVGGSDTAPNQFLVDLIPDLAFDTFLAQGGPTSDGQVGGFFLGGGAVDIGVPATEQFDSDEINQSWNPAPGNVIEDRNDFMIARLTLSEQYNGTLYFLTSAGGDVSPIMFAQFTNGHYYLEQPVAGDYDDSGQVSQHDLDLLLLNWGEEASPAPDGWVNILPVGQIGQAELDLVLLNWGKEDEVFSSVVPEPTSLLLYGLGLIGLAVSPRRRKQ